jgi:hypothetical protein
MESRKAIKYFKINFGGKLYRIWSAKCFNQEQITNEFGFWNFPKSARCFQSFIGLFI